MSADLMPVKNKAEIVNSSLKRKHYDSTRPVSFITESLVLALSASAKTRQGEECDYLLAQVLKARLAARGVRR